MINRLNNVVNKLWLTIILIVTTVLILLSAALITFLQSYLTKETEENLLEDAKRVNQVVEQTDDKETAIQLSRQLIEGSVGLIIMDGKNQESDDDHTKTKSKMLEALQQSDKYDAVFDDGKQLVEHLQVEKEGNLHTFITVGYPGSKTSNSEHQAVFIYQDLNHIQQTNNVITIIILITAVIFLAITTVFAFFLSSRITKPLRQLRTQAINLSLGNYSQMTPLNTKDEIGELSRAFNTMSAEIQRHIEALSSSKKIRDSLLDSMVEGVVGFNDDKEVILSNDMAQRIVRCMDEYTFEKMIEQNERTLQLKQTQFQEYEINTRYYVVIMSYIEQIQPDGQSGIVAVIRDMTSEHNVDQMKKDFIANVSHDLRTPISLLQGYTEAIVDGVVTEPEEIHDTLSIVLDESKRLNRLVNELLNVARMDAEGLTIEKETQPIDTLLEKMQHKYQQQADSLELQLELNPKTNQELWDYDTDRLEQVLTNLIDNAMRYTEPGDSIKIKTGENQEDQILYIEDTGSGIAPEHLELVFDRFYKVDASRKRGKQGTGLGLFICKMIIEGHGGTIDVKSERGKGTQFIIKLPKPQSES
ncbi:ATP-binding protein [Staphylococcus auricularis]|uniref:Sensor protein SrrB n=1 Tax=Staphylococcus auricularis TaxID=29379 RepID=A0ABX5IH23_9STAP|nr:ATP-binding protein [Staphylococcus auricularis]PTH19100.1 two-component sensor histidine kinase [Staphylococcus auricularis]